MLPLETACPLEQHILRKRRACPRDPFPSVLLVPSRDLSCLQIHLFSPSEHSNLVVRVKRSCHINQRLQDDKYLSVFRYLISFDFCSFQQTCNWSTSSWAGKGLGPLTSGQGEGCQTCPTTSSS